MLLRTWVLDSPYQSVLVLISSFGSQHIFVYPVLRGWIPPAAIQGPSISSFILLKSIWMTEKNHLGHTFISDLHMDELWVCVEDIHCNAISLEDPNSTAITNNFHSYPLFKSQWIADIIRVIPTNLCFKEAKSIVLWWRMMRVRWKALQAEPLRFPIIIFIKKFNHSMNVSRKLLGCVSKWREPMLQNDKTLGVHIWMMVKHVFILFIIIFIIFKFKFTKCLL